MKRKPSFIVLEDLKVRGMMKNRHLSSAIFLLQNESDRIYRCEYGMELDRDLNAAINLKNAAEYEIA